MPDGFSGKGPNNYQNNVLGYPLKPCSMDPLTGFSGMVAVKLV